MSLPRTLLLAAATVLTASLEAVSFDFTFSSAGATQTLTGTIDISAVSSRNYANWSTYAGVMGSPADFTINSLSMTLSGSPLGDGVYDKTGINFLYLSIPSDLNLSTELVGQYSSVGGFTFGRQSISGEGMFLIITNGNVGASNINFYYDSNIGYATVRIRDSANSDIGQTMLLTSLRPSGPTTITTSITASDARVTSGNVLQFQGGTFAPSGTGALNLSNDITVLAGSTATLDATGQDISSTGVVTISGTSLTLTGSTNSIITLSGNISGAGVLVNANGNNVISGTNTNGGTSVTGGSLRIANLASLPSSNNTVTSGGTIILPTEIAFSGAVTIAGAGGVGHEGALVLDSTSASTAGQSDLAVNLSGDATVVLLGGQSYSLSGAIAGTTPGQNLTLMVEANTLKLAGIMDATVVQMTKDGTGALTVDTTGVINSSTIVVADGLLTNNGIINGGISIATSGRLGGSGTINGSITVAGALAPGNSPGVLLQATGNTTLSSGATFVAELGGTTAGNGNGYHDQHYVQNGTFTIDPNVTLEVRSWVMADGVTTFTPERTNVFSILQASGGINGAFADITNPDYDTWMLYDNQGSAHTLGNLYGTGLLSEQTFAAYATAPWQVSILTSIWNQSVTASPSSTYTNPAGFIDSDTSAGKAAVIVLTSDNLSRDLALMSPEAYLAVSDFGLTVGRDLLGQALDNGSLWKEGKWTVGAGYSRSQHDYLGGGDAVSDYRLQSNSTVGSVRYQLAPTWQVGAFFGYTDGETNGAAASSKIRGNTFGLLADGATTLAGRTLALRAAVSYGELTSDMSRNGSKSEDQKMNTFSAELSASADVYKSEKLSFGPAVGVFYGHAKTGSFTEVGGVLPLSVAGGSNESVVSTAGLQLAYQVTSAVVVTAKAGWEHEFADAANVGANFAGSTGEGFSAAASQSRNTAVGGLGLGIRLPGAFTLNLSGEVRDNRQMNRNVVLGASVNRRF